VNTCQFVGNGVLAPILPPVRFQRLTVNVTQIKGIANVRIDSFIYHETLSLPVGQLITKDVSDSVIRPVTAFGREVVA